jgi:hypothetical protein
MVGNKESAALHSGTRLSIRPERFMKQSVSEIDHLVEHLLVQRNLKVLADVEQTFSFDGCSASVFEIGP